jgi:Family of unknown function (DUF6252)
MKTIKQFGIVLTIALTSLLSSCSSDDSSGGGGSTAALGTMKAKIGGTNFTSIAQGTTAAILYNGSYYNLSIAGADATGKVIQMMILAENITSGATYQIDENSDVLVSSAAYTAIDISNPTSAISFGAPYDGGGNSGSITISSKTETNVQGTFSFTLKNTQGTDTKSITNGSFNINLSN